MRFPVLSSNSREPVAFALIGLKLRPAMMLLLVQALSTFGMTALIWFVQLVAYPSFARVDPSAFAEFHAFHANRTTLVVAPLILAEAFSAAALVLRPEPYAAIWEAWVGLGLVGLLWASTAFLQVPMHRTLGAGFERSAWRFLCNSNWVRTLGWSLRSALVVAWLRRVVCLEELG